jgi:hypothetical protein
MVLLIGYDLNKPIQNYTGLFEAIKSYGLWWHGLDSTWFIETNSSPAEVFRHLSSYIDSNDSLIIIQVARNWWASGFSQEAYDWLKQRTF